MSLPADETPPTAPAEPALREVRYRHTSNLPEILRELRCSLLISTYQAGKLVAIGTTPTGLHFSFHNFDQAMGVAASPRRLAVGAKGQIWLHEANHNIAPTLAPALQFDRCYLARSAKVTGSIHCHEMAWDRAGELWVVNTLFSCLSTLHPEYSFIPRWRPPFITDLAAEDRCHLNGLAMRDGEPAFVTMMAATDLPAGWRPNKESTGLVMDIASSEVVTPGLAMPHSPRFYQNRLWVLNSGHGTLETVDLRSGRRDVVERMPGYTRGLAFCGPIAFVGLSRIRETAVFGGMPIAAERESLKCGVGVIDLRSGRTIATLEFESGVEEIFDVQVLPESQCPAICGPRPDQDGAQDIWIVPRPDQVEALSSRITEPRAPTRSVGRLASGDFGANIESVSPAASAVGSELWPMPARQSLVQQALERQNQGRVHEAIALFEQAARQSPPSAVVLNHLGNAYQDAGDQVTALECYRQAVHADPQFGPALQNYGYVLVAQGRTDEGVAQLRQAQAVQPTDVNHMLIATALPVVYESLDDLRTRRERLTSGVAHLADSGLKIDTTNTLIPTNFFAAYQGENDRDLHANMGRIYQGVEVRRAGGVSLAHGRTGDAVSTRIHVGFLSAYFRDHTIGRLNIGRIERLPRDKFEVTVFSVGKHTDTLAERFRQTADRHVTLPREVATARRGIADEQVDLLFFADVGMDALSYTLAFSRMAPVQMATWGHPVTTGSPTMDFFLSSELLETAEGDSHYTEKLLRPPSLCTYYERPALGESRKSRADFGLSLTSRLYLCPQTLFKFHPEFDEVLGGILRRDPGAEIVLIEGRTKNWTSQLQARFARTIPGVCERIRWLAPLANPDYLQLLALGDVMLDPLHFGGGNTSYESLAMGTPVVTLPRPYLKSRITLALYLKLAGDEPLSETPAPIATSIDEYFTLACTLAADSAERSRCRKWIAHRNGVLFEDDNEVADFVDCLARVCARP